jgi:hypothetical protein
LRAALRRRAIQRKAEAAGRAAGGVEIPKDGGRELGGDVRGRMEGALGTKLPSARVFDGAASADAARSLGARAFTDGADVHFAAGQYAPGTPDGDRLLAHELVHVAQGARGAGGVHRKAEPGEGEDLDVSQPGDAAEVEADELAEGAAGALHGRPRAPEGAKRAPSAELGGVGRKIHLTPDTGGAAQPAPQGPQQPAGAAIGAGGAGPAAGAHGAPQAASAPAGAAPPGGDEEQRLADAWPAVKAALKAGQPPQVNQLPPTAGNAAGVRRVNEINADENLPPDVRAAFFAELGTVVDAMDKPPTDLHGVLFNITRQSPDKYLRKGKKLPSADYAKNEMGGIRRALSLQWLVFNCTDDFLRRASQADSSIPDMRNPSAMWPLAGKIVQLIKTGKLTFDPASDVNGGAMIQGRDAGSSGWYFAGKDVPEGMAPPDLRVALAVGPEYAQGYQIVELPPEMAAPNDKGEGGASRPTALDLCLAPEGKLNPDQAEPFGRTDPSSLKPGQADAREVVMPPVALSATKRGPLVLG